MVSAACSGVRELTTQTFAPALTRHLVTASPSPVAPPVTMATCPDKSYHFAMLNVFISSSVNAAITLSPIYESSSHARLKATCFS